MVEAFLVFVALALLSGLLYDIAKKGGRWLRASGASLAVRWLYGFAIAVLPRFARDRYNEEWSAEFGEEMTLSLAWSLLRTAIRLRRDLEPPDPSPRRLTRRVLLAERERLMQAVEVAILDVHRTAALVEDLSRASLPARQQHMARYVADQLLVMQMGLENELRSPEPSRRSIKLLASLGFAVVVPFLWESAELLGGEAVARTFTERLRPLTVDE